MDWMTLSGYRLPPQVPGGGIPQQQQQQQQQHHHQQQQQQQQQQHDVSKLIVGDIPSPGLGGSVTGSLSLSPGLNLGGGGPCSTGSSSASSSPIMMNMWTNSIKVEASSGPSGGGNMAMSPPLGGAGGGAVSSPGSIKGQHLNFFLLPNTRLVINHLKHQGR